MAHTSSRLLLARYTVLVVFLGSCALRKRFHLRITGGIQLVQRKEKILKYE